jgi:dethiobiotin synthetase
VVIVEGAGGWRVPLTPSGYLSDFPEAEHMSVVMVIGLRLGCLNHAVLTAEAIQSGPCKLVGWVGNSIDPAFALLQQNLDTLRDRLPVPCLGVLPHAAEPDTLALSKLLKMEVLLA